MKFATQISPLLNLIFFNFKAVKILSPGSSWVKIILLDPNKNKILFGIYSIKYKNAVLISQMLKQHIRLIKSEMIFCYKLWLLKLKVAL